MQVLMALSDKYGGVIPINLKNQRVMLLSEPAHAERVLVSNADNYVKYFDGLRPIFGKSMITVDGALWQRIRAPQQAAFHPHMFEAYFPYLMSAIDSKMARWAKIRLDRRDHRDGGGDLDARRRDGVQGAVRPRDAVQSAFRLRPGQDLHRRDEPQVDPAQERARRARGDDPGRRRQGHGGVGPDPRDGDRRGRARSSRQDPAQDARGGGSRSHLPRIRSPAGDRRDEAISVGRDRDHRADARLVALSPVAAPRGARAHQGRSARGLRRTRSAMERDPAVELHAHGDPGDHAAVPADLGAHPHRGRRRRDRGPQDQGRRQDRDPRLCDAPQPEILGRAGEVRA